jgi:hypothetical protein
MAVAYGRFPPAEETRYPSGMLPGDASVDVD